MFDCEYPVESNLGVSGWGLSVLAFINKGFIVEELFSFDSHHICQLRVAIDLVKLECLLGCLGDLNAKHVLVALIVRLHLCLVDHALELLLVLAVALGVVGLCTPMVVGPLYTLAGGKGPPTPPRTKNMTIEYYYGNSIPRNFETLVKRRVF